MPLPNPVLPGTTYLYTRRTLERRFRLRPDAIVCQIVEFCLAYAAKISGVELHAYCVMSNHLHLILTDREGRLPEFTAWLNRHVACCLNAYQGRRGIVWDPNRPPGVELAQPVDVVEKTVYTLLNPVQEGLVARGDEWPGARSRIEELGVLEKVVKRPEVYFREGSEVDATATLRLTVPPGFSSAEEFQREISAKLEVKEGDLRREQEGKFVGARQVERMSIDHTPSRSEPPVELKPRLACQDKELREKLIERLVAFWHNYREARKSYCEEKAYEKVFPAGTYWMYVHLGVRRAAPTPAA